jgi:hypothetical protein
MRGAQKRSSSLIKFDLHAEDGTRKIALAVPEEELKKTIAIERAALESALAPAVTTSATTAPKAEGSGASAARGLRRPLEACPFWFRLVDAGCECGMLCFAHWEALPHG